MRIYRYATLVLLGIVLSPFFASAQTNVNQLIWGDVVTDGEIGEIISDDRITIVEGGTYKVQLNIAKNAEITYASEDFYMPRGALYYIPNAASTGTSTREFVKSFRTADALLWEKQGVYELDIYGEAPPFLAIKNKVPFWKIALWLIIGQPAHADSPEDVFLGTIRFTITDKDAVAKCTINCNSNVLFLPGIEGSRLYRPDYKGGTDKLWEPNTDGDVQDLYMNADGTSARLDIYAKERDVLDELPDGVNIYKSFIAKMDDLKMDDAINDWEPIAYDWRLSLDDILNYGNDMKGRIYYSGDLRATSTPYIIQELKRLAASSKTGKVTIVAHSNGGLIAKRMTELLGPIESAQLIDKMIFVAVPQAGTPLAIPAGLHGYEQDILFGLITSKETARTFASNSLMEYNLLPSAQYFTQVDDPVVTFDASLPDWIARYGNTIHSQERLHDFLVDSYGRVNSQTGDINQLIQFSDSLLSNAETLHKDLDNWTSPAGVDLIQIAGWGVPKTVEGTTYKKKDTGVTPEADFTIDGDGTVVVPSALWTSTTTGAVNYWMDLNDYNRDHPFLSGFGLASFDHSRILETSQLLDFLSDQITNTTNPLSSYSYLFTEVPLSTDTRLRYSLHSPLTLNLYDNAGRHTGVSTSTGEVEEQIPGTYYAEFGDVKYVFTDASAPAHIVMDGYAQGTFTFNIDQYTGDTLVASTTFKDIPTTASTTAILNIQSDIATLSSMQIDENGDGENIITLAPKLGEAVSYEPPAPTPKIISAGGGNRDTSIPDSIIATTTSTGSINSPQASSVQVTTEPVTTSTTVIATSTKPAQEKKKPPTPAVATIQKENKNIPQTPLEIRSLTGQTASVYNASQQPLFARMGTAVYNGLHSFWLALKKFF